MNHDWKKSAAFATTPMIIKTKNNYPLEEKKNNKKREVKNVRYGEKVTSKRERETSRTTSELNLLHSHQTIYHVASTVTMMSVVLAVVADKRKAHRKNEHKKNAKDVS